MKIQIKDVGLEQLKKIDETLNTVLKLFPQGDIAEIVSLMKDSANKKIKEMESPNHKINICIEATWSGYSSEQQKVVHREYRKIKQCKLAEYVERAKNVYKFEDNTCNYHSVKVVDKSKGDVIMGYTNLINEIFGGL